MDRGRLKLIALISMLLDHIGLVLVWPLYMDACWVDGVHMLGDSIPEKAKALYALYLALRIIGRLAFPIFAYMVVEGAAHTRSLKKYIGRLLLFAVIAEVPYNLALTGRPFYPWAQNVLWTLAIAAAMIGALEKYAPCWGQGRKGALCTAAVVGAAALAAVLCDGGLGGVLLIACMYLFKGDKRRWWLGCALSLCVLTALSMPIEIFALLSLVLLDRYNGEKGREGKYLFYVFYPAHLLALWAIAAWAA